MKQTHTIGALLLTLLLVGCKASADNKINIVIWEDDNNHTLIHDLLDNYQASYIDKYPDAPALTFTLLAEQESKAVSALGLQAPSGQGPDIFAFVHDTLSSAVTNNLIAEVLYDKEISLSHSLDSVSAFTFNQKLYGYPITAESLTLMYDKRVFSAAEVTSFENIKTSGKKIVLDVANNDSSAYYTFSFMTDAVLFGENGNNPALFDLNTAASAANLLALTKDYRSSIVAATPDSSLAILETNEAGAVISSPYLWPKFKEAVGESNAGIAVLPTLNGDPLRPFSGYKGYGVSRYAKNPHVAHDVARYLTNELAQRLRFSQKGILPTFVSPTITNLVANDPVASVYQQSATYSLLMPNITQMGSFWAPANDAVTSIWNLGTNATLAEVSGLLAAATTTIKNAF
ncbi:MAG: extracellular solute-binding protein [Bacilli bacterium]